MKNRLNLYALLAVISTLPLFSGASYAQLSPQLTLLSHWNGHAGPDGYNSLWGWSGNGREYAILGSLDTIYFFDVTNPSQIRLCDARAGRYNFCVNREFRTYKNYCYAVADANNCSLQIFDLKYLPDSVHKVYDADTLSSAAHSLFIEGDRLYLSWNKRIHGNEPGSPARHETNDVLTVASLQNPEAPTFIANLRPPTITIDGSSQQQFEYVHDLFVRNDTAYCCCGPGGMYIYNYKDPYNPSLIQAITGYNGGQPGFTHSCWLSTDGNLLVFTDETPQPVELYDVSALKDSTNTQPILYPVCVFGSHSYQGSIGHNAYMKGSLIYMSYYEDGVVVFDMSDSANVHEIASYDTYPQNLTGSYNGLQGCWNVYPYFNSGTIIASDISNGLFVLKLDSVSGINSNYMSSPSLDIKILQNPFQNDIQMVADAKMPENLNINVYDMLGQRLYTSVYACGAGTNAITIPCAAGLSGTVLLTITSGNDIFTRKLVKIGG